MRNEVPGCIDPVYTQLMMEMNLRLGCPRHTLLLVYIKDHTLSSSPPPHVYPVPWCLSPPVNFPLGQVCVCVGWGGGGVFLMNRKHAINTRTHLL